MKGRREEGKERWNTDKRGPVITLSAIVIAKIFFSGIYRNKCVKYI